MRLEIIKKLNEEFCESAIEVAKNLSMRNIKKKLQLKDISPINYKADRVDRNLINKDGSYLFYLDIENHKAPTLKDMIRESYEITKLINDNLPNKFATKFSGRGFHMCALIKNDEKTVKFLKDNKIETVYDFVKGIAYGISVHLKLSSSWLDTQQMNKNGMIRGFCVNDKAMLNNRKMYSVPVNLQVDDINAVINKSLLLKDFDNEFKIPDFDLYNLYKIPPTLSYYKQADKRLLQLKMSDANTPIDFNIDTFAPCLKALIQKGKDGVLGNEERSILIRTLLSVPIPPVDILRIFKQYMSKETFDKMWKENQIAYNYNNNKFIRNCEYIKGKGYCIEGCKRRRPFFLEDE